jgi:hypothetical protein
MCGEEILAVAKKCKHCGEYLDGRNGVPASSELPRPAPGNSLGIIILSLPIASAALMWFWISGMNLLQNPSYTLDGILIVTILLTAGSISTEASHLGMGKPRGGKETTGPIGWFLCTLLMWIIAYPGYLFWRSKYGVKNYVIGGIASALVFLSVAGLLTYAIERQRSVASHGIPSVKATQLGSPTATQNATPPSAKLETFIAEARRFISALETGVRPHELTGVTPHELNQLVVELRASSEEANNDIADNRVKNCIKDLVQVIEDTNAMFGYASTHKSWNEATFPAEEDRVAFSYSENLAGWEAPPGRWRTNPRSLLARYGFSEQEYWIADGELQWVANPMPRLYAVLTQRFNRLESVASGK